LVLPFWEEIGEAAIERQPMWVVSKKLLREHWEKPGRRDSEAPLKTWYDVANAARWHSHNDVKGSYGVKVDLAYGRYVFNIGGNKYRLICRIDFTRHGVLTLWVGTHTEYDELCAEGGKLLQKL
jgi:mRNA interferase HigB